MPLWRLYYHVVFATHLRQTVLTSELRRAAAGLFGKQAAELGCVLHAAHAQPEHAHLVLSIPPRHAVATVIGRIKGNSSHALAGLLPEERFTWQSGYGVFSFGERHLASVVHYVHEQDRRHATGKLWLELERTTDRDEDDGPTPFTKRAPT